MSGPSPSHIDIATSPFLLKDRTTDRIMYEVLGSLLPVLAAAAWFFGISALLVVMASVCGAGLVEWFFRSDRVFPGSLKDGTALLTGLLLGLTLPPSFPLWMAFLGGAVGLGLGKLIWGGMGNNLFNPALVGRAFLQAAFPGAITTWTEPGNRFLSMNQGTLAMPMMQSSVDGISSATPLGLAKFDNQLSDLSPMLLGNTAGSLGETSALLLLICGAWLAARRIFDWRLPVSMFLAVAVCSSLLHWTLPGQCPPPSFMLLSGGLMFGAVFMATDPVTTPITPRGAWIFGAGSGALVVLIRVFGGLPEGVMYAILLMNSVTPLINRHTQPRRFGG